MERILIVSGSNGAAVSLSGFLRDSFRCTPRIVESAYQARMALENDRTTELVLINSPLIDETGVELAQFVTKQTAANCILMIKQDAIERMTEMAEHFQVILLGRPLNKAMLYQIIRIIDISVKRSQSIYEENRRLEQKIKDIRTVDRAKFLLMQFEGMTEEEAHAYLEKYAMDKRRRKPIAALEIIDRINEQYL
ncbi:MAG: ANTAR domain-containing protein [Oscillospiraceae bacterium]|nr:ANTAR domain-containing protein [Oscillospiraceae bacterium]